MDEIISTIKKLWSLEKTKNGFTASYEILKSVKGKSTLFDVDKKINNLQRHQKEVDELIKEQNTELTKLRDKINMQEVPKMNIPIEGAEEEREFIKEKIISVFEEACSEILIEDKGDVIQLVFKN